MKNENEVNATLMSHVNSDKVTRQELATLPPPVGTATFRPIPHIELVETIERALRRRDWNIVDEQLALRRDGNMLFGVLKLESIQNLTTLYGGNTFALGLRTANNREMAIQLCAGLSVFVCDNMCFRGDLIALKRKHTSGLNLIDEVTEGIVRYEQHANLLAAKVENLKQLQLTDGEAKATLFDIFIQHQAAPLRLLPAVWKEYSEPKHVEFEPRTPWSLHNAFTEVAKEMPLSTRMPATQAVGRYFGI